MTDVAAERAVLVGLFQYGEDAYLDIADFINDDSFTDVLNQVIFKCIQHLYTNKEMKNFDQVSLLACASELGLQNFFSQTDDIRHLRSIINGKVQLENVRIWAGQIRKLQIGRLLRDQLNEASVTIEDIKGTESLESILGIAENIIFDFSKLLHSEESSTPALIGNDIDAYLDMIEANPVKVVGISSGMPYYDQAIGGGFRRKTVSLLSGRPKSGKSVLAVNIAIHVAKILKIPVLYLDTEMSKEDHWARLLPKLCLGENVQVTINEIETGQYAKNSYQRNSVRKAAQILKQSPFYYLNVSGKAFEETLSIMRRWVAKEVGFNENGTRKDCLIIYDYIKLMHDEDISGNLSEYQILGFMMTSLHNFAVHYDVPVLTFAQLNRDGIDRESTAVISGSDRILWLVTNFTIYKVKTDEEIAEIGPQHGNRKLVPVSARHGEGLEPGDYINVKFHGKFGHIEEGETKFNLLSQNKTTQHKPDDK